MIGYFMDLLQSFAWSVLDVFVGVLPSADIFNVVVSNYQDSIVLKAIGWFNYFVDVGTIVAMFLTWLTAITTYNVVKGVFGTVSGGIAGERL